MEYYLGEIRIFAGTYAPEDWAFCEGQSVSVQQYPALFALLGTAWGGDGQTSFNLPDFRGRIPVGQGTGASPTLTPRTIGQKDGVETVTLTEAQMPSHMHYLMAASVTATTQTPDPAMVLGKPGCANPSAPTGLVYATETGAARKFVLNSASLEPAGNSMPHLNVMRSIALHFIIALQGIYPQRP